MSRGGVHSYDPDREVYRWSKISWLLFLVVFSIEVYCVFMLYIRGVNVIYIGIGFLAIAVFGFFYNITVAVDGHGLITTFGIGLIRTEIDVGAIDTTHISKNNKLVPMLYNPLGENSLLIKLRGGETYSVPCDNVKLLQQKLERRY